MLCSCEQPQDSQEPSEWITAKVAVVLPLSEEDNDKMRYKRICEMFEENVIKAQLNETVGVKLELEWFDENIVNINQLANELYNRTDIKAIIGPLKDGNIANIAPLISDKGIPMFVMTSSEEILRRYTSGTAGVKIKEPFLWSLSETDAMQARLPLLKAGSMGKRKISVVSVDNNYGHTFNKWVPYHANEIDMTIVDRIQYSTTQELEDAMNMICKSEAEAVVCALDNANDIQTVMQIVEHNPAAPKVYFTGAGLNSPLLKLGSLVEGAEGFAMYPSPYTGFQLAYQVRYGEMPMPIEAQLYDAFLLSLVSFAYSHYSEQPMSMNKALAALSDLPTADVSEEFADLFWEYGTPAWDYSGLKNLVLNKIRKGELPDKNMIGACGNLKFAAGSYTKLIKNCYINWLVYEGKPVALDFIDERGFRLTKYIPTWVWQEGFEELEDNSDSKFKYKEAKGNKAVLICGSEGWYNYRHQADILHVYQNLKTNGFTDDDIILIMRDDIANHQKNTDKGAIRVKPRGENLYINVQLDYRADTISLEDIENILVGNKSDRLSTVLESTETDNVLLYWTGHGTKGAFSWLETKEKFTAIQLRETVQKMYDNKLYQSMLICAEPCYSGSVVKEIEGIPLVLAISAADENESSFADNFNSELNVWMCDRFTNSMMRILEKNRHTNFSDLYEELHNSTLGSHVCVHNIRMFYYLQICTLSDYFYVYNQ